MAGWLKQNHPGCRVLFMGRTYTRDVVALSRYVDAFINYDEIEKAGEAAGAAALAAYKADIVVHVFPQRHIARLVKQAGIPLRVGTTNRLYHWLFCNRLVRLSRKKSFLHEAQLNLKLLAFAGLKVPPDLAEVPALYGFTQVPPLADAARQLLSPNHFNLILHPRSKGSAVEWGLDNFKRLVDALPDRYRVFVSGTAQDATGMQDLLQHPRVNDLTGKFSLPQFIAFIHHADGLVAASTGPLHLAAALNKKALGLFSPRRPIHPGRWAPLGSHAGWLVADPACAKCAAGHACNCITAITPQQVIHQIEQL